MELGKIIFIGTETGSYDTLKSIIGNELSWDKNLTNEEKIIEYDVLFFEKKAFYKYHKLLENTVPKQGRTIYLINDQEKITQEEIMPTIY